MLLTRIQKSAQRYPDAVAVQMKAGEGYLRLTYQDLLRQVASLAASLKELGIEKGDRVAVLSENRPEWMVAYLAVVAAGGVIVPLDAQLMAKEVELLLASAEAKAVFVSAACQGKLPRGSSITIVSFDPGYGRLFSDVQKAHPGAALPPSLGADVFAALLFTSGTTGDPKGVMLSQGNLASNVDSVVDLKIAGPGDNLLCLLPLHHAYPAMGCMLLPLSIGATVTILNSLKGPDILSCMKVTRVTAVIGVPQLFTGLRRALFDEIQKKPRIVQMLVRVLLGLNGLLRRYADINAGKVFFSAAHAAFGPRFRLFASGGARLEPDVQRDMTELGFTIIEGYGLSETSPACTFNQLKKQKAGSIGVPLPGVEVTIINPDENGRGELAVRGPNVMLGYYKKPHETAEALRDGWFFTGDLGYRDREGYFFITGRSKEMIVLPSGKKIFPEELEKVYKRIPAIKEFCLIESERGLEAAAVPDFEYLRKMNLPNSRETIAFQMEDLAKDLPPYQRIMGLKIFKGPLPVTNLGKLRRKKVRELYWKEGERIDKPVQAVHDDLLNDATMKKLLVCLGPYSAKKNIAPEDNLELDLGLDSLARVELIVSLESAFGVRLPDSFGAEVFTVSDAVKKLKALAMAEPVTGPGREQTAWSTLLSQEPAEEAAGPPALESGPFWKAFRFAAKNVLSFLFLVYGRLSVRGAENLPPNGPYLLAPNHLSLVDAPALIASISWNVLSQTFFLGTTVFFGGPVSSRMAGHIQVIPVDIDARLYRAMQMSAYVLRRGKILCVFPEGGRSRDGETKEFKKGVGILARELNIPVVPVAIQGTYEMLAAGKRFPRPTKVTVTFGKPFSPGGLDYDGIVKKLREEVVAMLEGRP